MRSADIAANPLGHSVETVEKAESTIRSIGGGALDLTAGGIAGRYGSIYGESAIVPTKLAIGKAKNFLSAHGILFESAAAKTAQTAAETTARTAGAAGVKGAARETKSPAAEAKSADANQNAAGDKIKLILEQQSFKSDGVNLSSAPFLWLLRPSDSEENQDFRRV